MPTSAPGDLSVATTPAGEALGVDPQVDLASGLLMARAESD
jgi:hypothetical protein